MRHKCHAYGCDRNVPPRLLMCYKHWCMVPRSLQRNVWFTYREGQEVTKDPSVQYLRAASAAIEAVKKEEGWE